MEILIVDDDRVLVQMLSRRLKANNFTVAAAFDAMQATMVAVRNPPDAIVLDIGMPAGSGVEVLKRLKESVKTTHIPIIVLSGSSDPNLPKIAQDLGAEDFLAKPLDFDLLHRILCRVLGRPLK